MTGEPRQAVLSKDVTMPTPDPRMIDAAVIERLYLRVEPLLFANFGALLLITVALWPSVDHAYLLGWAAMLSLWTLLRYDLACAYRARPRQPEEARRWLHFFAAGSGVAGCLWGAAAWLMGDLAGDRAMLVQAFMMAALSAAAIAGYSNSMLAFTAFFFPAVLPFGSGLIWRDGNLDALALAFFGFWCVLMWVMARHLNLGLRQSLALSIKNAELAERFRAQRDRAEAASLATSRFLGNMSHELRTPLNAVLGYTDMMREEVFGPLGDRRYAGYVNDIHKSGEYLLRAIDQILDIAAIQSGDTDLRERETTVAPLIGEAVAAFRDRAEALGIGLHVEIADALPALYCDPRRLSQIVSALLDNAIRFTPAGGAVTVRAIATGDSVAIHVIDTGIGMAQEDVQRVLLPFGRAESVSPLAAPAQPSETARRNVSSIGFGLTLARLLAQAHGAALRLDSALGQGTTVIVDFSARRNGVEGAVD